MVVPGGVVPTTAEILLLDSPSVAKRLEVSAKDTAAWPCTAFVNRAGPSAAASCAKPLPLKRLDKPAPGVTETSDPVGAA